MLNKSPDVAGRRKRLVALCRALPEAEAERAGVLVLVAYFLTAPDELRKR